MRAQFGLVILAGFRPACESIEGWGMPAAETLYPSSTTPCSAIMRAWQDKLLASRPNHPPQTRKRRNESYEMTLQAVRAETSDTLENPGRPDRRLDRWLGQPGVDDPSTIAQKARTFRLLVLLNLVANEILLQQFETAAALGVCLLGAAFRRTARLSMVVAALIFVDVFFGAFPRFANHNYLQLILLIVVASLRFEKAEEQVLLMQVARWLTVFVFFWSGLKKVMFGTYFGGEFLAFIMTRSPHFAEFFGIFVPDAEILRLRSYSILDPGVGPFRVDSLLFVAVSNAVYLAELFLAALLVWRRARPYAWLFGIAVIVGIEIAAREGMFGMLCISLFLCFPERDLNRRLLPLLVAMYVAGLSMSFGLVPGFKWN